MPFVPSEQNRRRLIVSLIAEELGRLRQRETSPAESLGWSDGLELGEGAEGESLGLDSLGRIDVAARLNQFFHLHEVGIEDYLLIEKTLGRWSAIVAESFRIKWESVTFQTSGSTGVPGTCTHLLADLVTEAHEHTGILKTPRRIISMVPPHHIYGFIFTVVLPGIMGIEVVDARVLSPGRIRTMLQDGDCIIATPHLWRYLATSIPSFPAGVSGTSSTAPMPVELAQELQTRGLMRLTEIYGSSETAGIGWRQSPLDAFTLLDLWLVSDDGEALSRRQEDGSAGTPMAFGDIVTFDGPRRLRPVGRRDGAVQIGGVNVFPERVRRFLEEHEAVSEATVRPFAVGGDAARQRLKAFIVARETLDISALEKALRRHAAAGLSEVERPVAYHFGSSLPRNAIGKLTDWES
jgi:4-coumarate--CoA ligase (photoactive yellow protein activation family)